MKKNKGPEHKIGDLVMFRDTLGYIVDIAIDENGEYGEHYTIEWTGKCIAAKRQYAIGIRGMKKRLEEYMKDEQNKRATQDR